MIGDLTPGIGHSVSGLLLIRVLTHVLVFTVADCVAGRLLLEQDPLDAPLVSHTPPSPTSKSPTRRVRQGGGLASKTYHSATKFGYGTKKQSARSISRLQNDFRAVDAAALFR